MTLHAAADYGGAFEYMDDPDDLFTLDTIYSLLNAMKDHNHALDKGTPVARVVFGIEADRPTTTPNEGWVYVATDTHAFWFADGAQWNQVFVLSDETIPVGAGGTGDDTLLIHAVLLGKGTDPITWAAVGVDHSVLQGHTAADPAFTTTPTLDGLTVDGNEHITGTLTLDGDLDVGGTVAGITVLKGETGWIPTVTDVIGDGLWHLVANVPVTAGATYLLLLSGYYSSAISAGSIEIGVCDHNTPLTPIPLGGSSSEPPGYFGVRMDVGAGLGAPGTILTASMTYVPVGTQLDLLFKSVTNDNRATMYGNLAVVGGS